MATSKKNSLPGQSSTMPRDLLQKDSNKFIGRKFSIKSQKKKLNGDDSSPLESEYYSKGIFPQLQRKDSVKNSKEVSINSTKILTGRGSSIKNNTNLGIVSRNNLPPRIDNISSNGIIGANISTDNPTGFHNGLDRGSQTERKSERTDVKLGSNSNTTMSYKNTNQQSIAGNINNYNNHNVFRDTGKPVKLLHGGENVDNEENGCVVTDNLNNKPYQQINNGGGNLNSMPFNPHRQQKAIKQIKNGSSSTASTFHSNSMINKANSLSNNNTCNKSQLSTNSTTNRNNNSKLSDSIERSYYNSEINTMPRINTNTNISNGFQKNGQIVTPSQEYQPLYKPPSKPQTPQNRGTTPKTGRGATPKVNDGYVLRGKSPVGKFGLSNNNHDKSGLANPNTHNTSAISQLSAISHRNHSKTTVLMRSISKTIEVNINDPSSPNCHPTTIKQDPLITRKSHSNNGNIKAYSAGTHNGLIRNYNEDRLSIVLNYKVDLGNNHLVGCNFFGIYDGHGGYTAADNLKNYLHKNIFLNEHFPHDLKKCCWEGCRDTEAKLEENALASTPVDRSGSCGVFCLNFEEKLVFGNIGDSRAIMSSHRGKKIIQVTQDHKPNFESESLRIRQNGGEVYRTNPKGLNLSSKEMAEIKQPWRVNPGRLSVSRTFGDVLAKKKEFGGKAGVIIAEPDIFEYQITPDLDFLILACDGVFDRLENDDIINNIWNLVNTTTFYSIHEATEIMVNIIFEDAIRKMSYDNISIIFLAFEGFINELKIHNEEPVSNPDASDILNKTNNLNPNLLPSVPPKFFATNIQGQNKLAHSPPTQPKEDSNSQEKQELLKKNQHRATIGKEEQELTEKFVTEKLGWEPIDGKITQNTNDDNKACVTESPTDEFSRHLFLRKSIKPLEANKYKMSNLCNNPRPPERKLSAGVNKITQPKGKEHSTPNPRRMGPPTGRVITQNGSGIIRSHSNDVREIL